MCWITVETVDALALASLDKVLETLESELFGMESWLHDRAAAIESLSDDCTDTEEENRKLEQQWKSYYVNEWNETFIKRLRKCLEYQFAWCCIQICIANLYWFWCHSICSASMFQSKQWEESCNLLWLYGSKANSESIVEMKSSIASCSSI